MRRLPALIYCGLLGLAACGSQQNNALSSVSPLPSGMARVWILRQTDVAYQNYAADPAVFINDVDLGHIARGTVFYHDVQPGTYSLRVQPYGEPTHVTDTVQLGSGKTAFLQVQGVANWEQGSAAGGSSFAVLTMVPQDAEAAIPTLTFVGQR